MCILWRGYSRTRTIHGDRKRHAMSAIPIAVTDLMSAALRSFRCPQNDFLGPVSSVSAGMLGRCSATSRMGYPRRAPAFFSSRKLR